MSSPGNTEFSPATSSCSCPQSPETIVCLRLWDIAVCLILMAITYILVIERRKTNNAASNVSSTTTSSAIRQHEESSQNNPNVNKVDDNNCNINPRIEKDSVTSKILLTDRWSTQIRRPRRQKKLIRAGIKISFSDHESDPEENLRSIGYSSSNFLSLDDNYLNEELNNLDDEDEEDEKNNNNEKAENDSNGKQPNTDITDDCSNSEPKSLPVLINRCRDDRSLDEDPLQDDGLSITQIRNIRKSVTAAELDWIAGTKELRNDLRKGAVCFSCLKRRFSLLSFRWAAKCSICSRTVCRKCITVREIDVNRKIKVPYHLLSPSRKISEAASDISECLEAETLLDEKSYTNCTLCKDCAAFLDELN